MRGIGNLYHAGECGRMRYFPRFGFEARGLSPRNYRKMMILKPKNRMGSLRSRIIATFQIYYFSFLHSSQRSCDFHAVHGPWINSRAPSDASRSKMLPEARIAEFFRSATRIEKFIFRPTRKPQRDPLINPKNLGLCSFYFRFSEFDPPWMFDRVVLLVALR